MPFGDITDKTSTAWRLLIAALLVDQLYMLMNPPTVDACLNFFHTSHFFILYTIRTVPPPKAADDCTATRLQNQQCWAFKS